MIRQYELVEKVRSYDADVDERLLDRAYVFSLKAHGNQKRYSGDPYFSHPLEVAGILTEMKLDGATIATALLHDTIEDTLATRSELEGMFGAEVAQLVDGVTKLSQIELASESHEQAENFRKFVLAMSNDIRVLLVKLADRLHNMRTLHYVPDADKRRRTAAETLEIYAPLAERIGMQSMKNDLQDLAFMELYPDARESIVTRLGYMAKKAGSIRARVVKQLKKKLKDNGIKAEIISRQKQPYSIWGKMQRDDISFESLSDIMGFRLVVEDVEACYRTLGIVHAAWQVVPGRFKDYISTPKRNNYQSLHTTVIGPERQRIEVQIRTREMHDVATYGVAAHWGYKQKAGKVDGTQYRWLQELLEILEEAESPEEFLEHTKIELYTDQVFCFTPKGELTVLPRGATPIDFAYAVHTDVGNSCVGAKVNGKFVPLRMRLKNGDQVEIVRSKAQTPQSAWEGMVATGKARSAIRRFLRNSGQGEFAALGESVLRQSFSRVGYQAKDQNFEEARRALHYKSLKNLFAEVGKGNVTPLQVLEAQFPGVSFDGKKLELDNGEPSNGADSVLVRGAHPGSAVSLAECCFPLPGDRIVGIIVPEAGMTVHTIDCETLESMIETEDRLVDVSWDPKAMETGMHPSSITIRAINEPGALGKIATLVGKNRGNMTNLKMQERNLQYFSMNIDMEVKNAKHLTNIVAALRTLGVVESVERVRG